MRRGEHTTSQRRAGVALVRDAGLSLGAAAKQAGVGITTMRRWCASLGVSSPFPVQRYSQQIVNRAREMRAAQVPIDVIARRLAVRRDTVKGWVADLGPGKPGNPNPGKAPQVLEMLREGRPCREICAATGLHCSTVYRWARALRRGQLPARYTPPT